MRFPGLFPVRFHLVFFQSFRVFVSYIDFFNVVVVFGTNGTPRNVAFLQLVWFRDWVLTINNEPCNALKCLKPSALIDFVICRLCNRWVQTKCANLSRTEAGGLAELKCCRCFLVNSIPRCPDHNFRPDNLFESGVVHFERIPKFSLIPLAENVTPKTNDTCETPSNVALSCLLLFSLLLFIGKTTSRR